MSSALIRGGKLGHTYRHRQYVLLKADAETGVLLSQATEWQGLPQTRRGMEGSLPRGFRVTWSCQHLDFFIFFYTAGSY